MSEFLNADERLNQKHWSELRVEASPFRSAFEYAAIGMLVADTEGRYLAANRAVCEMLGYTEEELLRLDYSQITHPDDVTENTRLGLQLAAGQVHFTRMEKRYLHKQGHIVWAQISGSLVRDDYGHPLYLITQVQDITERKQAETAEREQRDLAEALRDTIQALSTTRNLDELLDRILENAHRMVPYDFGTIMLIDERGEAYFARTRSRTRQEFNDVLLTTRFSPGSTANLRLMADSGRPVLIPDVQAYPGWITLPGLSWVRAYVGAPIRLESHVFGFINFVAEQPRTFTAAHAAHLQSLAQQTAIAIENIRLLQAERGRNEIAEALRETAAALNSTLNLTEVFDLILANAARVVPYDAINIMLLDEKDLATVVRSRGYDERGIGEFIRNIKVPTRTTYGLLNIMNTHQPYRVNDTWKDSRWVRLLDSDWQRSYLAVPIRLKGDVVGFLNFDSATPHFFTSEQAIHAQAFADQVALAMQNAQSYEAIQQHVRRLTLLHEVSVVVALAQTPPQLHQQIVRAARLLVDAEAGYLTLFDQRDQLVIAAVENLAVTLLGQAIPLGRGINGRAAQLRQLLHVRDYGEFHDRLPIFEGQPVSGIAAMPLLWQRRLVGTLCVINQQPRQFDENDLQVLNLFAALAAAALEQRRAMSEAQAREAEARSLSSRLVNAQEEERSRIASLLHDSIGGQLTLIQKNTELLRSLLLSDIAALPEQDLHTNGLRQIHQQATSSLDAMLEGLQQVHQQVRHLAIDLNSKVLSELGLIPAARQHVEQLVASTRLPISLHITGRARRLPPEIERLAFRALQETLNNVLRHAQATEIAAQLHLGSKTLRLTVQDNGRGFDEQAGQQGTSLGLPYLRRQVEQLGGDLFIESSPRNGSLIALRLPLRAQAENGIHRTRVLVVDDHEMMRQGLWHILAASDDFVCVGEASDSHEALRQIETCQPDLVIMDVKLPGGSGIEATRQLLKRYPHVRVIFYTYHDDEMYLEQAFQAGAQGYLLKSDPNQLLFTALRAVQSGEIFISPTLADKWTALQRRPVNDDSSKTLTIRERQVLQLIANGHSNQLVAESLDISVRTVEVHRRNIMDKLGVTNLAGMIKFAMEHSLL